MDKNIGKKLDGRYEITELIGTGGMADVYKATDIIENRVVAVKILKPEFSDNEEFKRCFRNESKAIALLSHPNIVKILDVSFNERLQFIVMEFIDGITLKEYMEREGTPLKWSDSVHFITQILRALQHAHDRGVVHRDIKPQNIMVFTDESIKVMDFGIAKFAREEGKKLSDKAIGSVHYISPEQAKGEQTNDKSDIYSVGVMFYEMLTGKKPFDSDDPVQVAIMHMQKEPEKPSAINPSIPPALEAIILKAMSKDPSKRYQSASDMIKDIEKFKQNPDAAANPDPAESGDKTRTRYYTPVVLPNEELPDEEDYDDDDDNADDDSDYDEDIDDDEEEDEDEEEHRPRSLFVPILTAVVLCVLLVLGFFVVAIISKSMGGSDVSDGEHTMPDLVTMDYDTARNTYTWLNFEVLTQEWTTYEENTIFDQDIEVGRPVESGQTVKVSVSYGIKLVEVPNTYGYTEKLAIDFINQYKLVVSSTIYQPDDTVEQGCVINTVPEKGEKVPTGTPVTIYVSQGREDATTIMKDVRGSKIDEARLRLEAMDLVVLVEEADSKQDAGVVIEQSIAYGTVVEKGTEVTLTISTGIAPASTVSIAVDKPADAAGRFIIAAYIDGTKTTEKIIDELAYADDIKIDVEGTKTAVVTLEITNSATGRSGMIGKYNVDFTEEKYTPDVSSHNSDIWKQIGAVTETTTVTTTTTTTPRETTTTTAHTDVTDGTTIPAQTTTPDSEDLEG